MSVKLIKACKELNIGMGSLTLWCEKNGYKIESDPHYPISDELFGILKQYFAQHPEGGVRLDNFGYCGIDTFSTDSDYYSPNGDDTLNDAFEGEEDLYNEWLNS